VKSDIFWHYFETEVRPKLAVRADTFARIFAYLDAFDRPVGIVETGCVRKSGNWAGDGGSTILFDKYAECHPGSFVHTVDIDPQATALCRALVTERVAIHTGDSVAFLKRFADAPPPGFPSIDLLYLDSFDLDPDNIFPSAFHHMKELTAISPAIRPETLVVVDDSPSSFLGVIENGKLMPISTPKIGGKGKLIAEYAGHIGAEQVFMGYQCGWTRFRGRAES
jgi:hypothetical protein